MEENDLEVERRVGGKLFHACGSATYENRSTAFFCFTRKVQRSLSNLKE